jgi:beta-N-acetylhexosaminidase
VGRDRLRRLYRAPWFASVAALAVAALVAGVAVSVDDGGGGGDRGSPAARTGATGAGGPRPRSFLARLIPPPGGSLPGARVPGQIHRLVARLPLERKAAQLMLVGFTGRDPSIAFFRTLARFDFGGVVLERRNYADPIQLEAMTTSVANATARRGHEPPLVLARQSGGSLSAFPDLPPAGEPGELAGTSDAADQYARTAAALKDAGLSGVIGPPLDVSTHEADELGTLAFSDDPEEVAAYARAGVGAFRRARMLVAPEHFPGGGAATEDTDEGPAQVGLTLPELERRDLVPFRAAIDAGAQALLVGHASYAPDDFVLPASLSRNLTTNLLRGGLGFRGVAISDDLAAAAVITTQPSIAAAAVAAIAAGVDMVWISGPASSQMRAYRAILAAARRGAIPRTRLDAAVTRIVTVKRELGLRLRRREPPPQWPNAAQPGTGPATPPPLAPVLP